MLNLFQHLLNIPCFNLELVESLLLRGDTRVCLGCLNQPPLLSKLVLVLRFGYDCSVWQDARSHRVCRVAFFSFNSTFVL